ncbi:hypothetical protein M427DRAFT_412306 [Gonapodya prolifera JEL478]|uniref:DNA mismatch repair protein S5 domain-containing protein n=1 Tax=Gonapodya prolifera (strain JEL478) TaxID=1344416 RepID=A0A139A5T6_GONPJ|nr:hypothetical protein M427DRAFT_412306 [Gonapodya prolifera JEL478]|eukprot:KXS12018.1 hypothetical protein M427DRAFT_412306 [Gonapodya prolifera JEL478]
MPQVQQLPNDAIRKLRSTVVINSVAQLLSEVLQNSLDAGATVIDITFDANADDLFVEVSDNGEGIRPEDLKMVGQRYHTSKCSNLDDLKKLETYGFRGEALSSASDVALVEIQSRHRDHVQSFASVVQDGRTIRYGPSLIPRKGPGTTVTARNIFSKFSVRLKRVNSDEIRDQVQRAVETIILVWPQLSLTLVDRGQQRRIITKRKTNSLSVVFQQLFGASIAQHLSQVDYKSGEYQVSGVISSRGHHTKLLQFIYVNNHALAVCDIHKRINQLFTDSDICRPADSEDINQTVGGSETRLGPSRERKTTLEKYGIFALCVTCPPSAYDILIDPSKSHVEFADWDAVLLAFEHAVTEFLDKIGLIPKPTESSTTFRFVESQAVTGTGQEEVDSRPRKRKLGTFLADRDRTLEPNYPELLGVRGNIDWRKDFAPRAKSLGALNETASVRTDELVTTPSGVSYLEMRSTQHRASVYVDKRTGFS